MDLKGIYFTIIRPFGPKDVSPGFLLKIIAQPPAACLRKITLSKLIIVQRDTADIALPCITGIQMQLQTIVLRMYAAPVRRLQRLCERNNGIMQSLFASTSPAGVQSLLKAHNAS